MNVVTVSMIFLVRGVLTYPSLALIGNFSFTIVRKTKPPQKKKLSVRVQHDQTYLIFLFPISLLAPHPPTHIVLISHPVVGSDVSYCILTRLGLTRDSVVFHFLFI